MVLDKILYKKKMIQQAQDVLSGEYRHFQCDDCEHYFDEHKYRLRHSMSENEYSTNRPLCSCMGNPWTEEHAEKFHNRWRKCKYHLQTIKWPHPPPRPK